MLKATLGVAQGLPSWSMASPGRRGPTIKNAETDSTRSSKQKNHEKRARAAEDLQRARNPSSSAAPDNGGGVRLDEDDDQPRLPRSSAARKLSDGAMMALALRAQKDSNLRMTLRNPSASEVESTHFQTWMKISTTRRKRFTMMPRPKRSLGNLTMRARTTRMGLAILSMLWSKLV